MRIDLDPLEVAKVFDTAADRVRQAEQRFVSAVAVGDLAGARLAAEDSLVAKALGRPTRRVAANG